MVLHTFLFRWKPGVPDTKKSEALQAIRALQGQIPGLLATYAGINTSPRSDGYELGGVMHFTDAQALATYNTHPVHLELISWLMPLIDPVEVDFDPQL